MKIPGLRSCVGGSAAVVAALFCAPAHATQFSAVPDRAEISVEESVAIKFTVESEGNSALEDLQFAAPDFDLINEYTSSFVQSYYENGRFGMRNSRQITKVLRPRKEGTLVVGGIKAKVDGKWFNAPQIAIRVSAGGGGTPPPRGYGGAGIGLRGAGKTAAAGKAFFMRAEVDKNRAYKGEQIIVSYYLYRRVRTFNPEISKFPVLNGFLREDLEVPQPGQALTAERVALDGQAYERILLGRYAAYPLKEGKLSIDSMSLKVAYYGQRGGPGGDGEDDPFFQFFQSAAPLVGTASSETIPIEALPLPEAGRPASFSGGVGDFTVTAAVNRYDLPANEALTLTLKIEGRGNVASIQQPQVAWPESVEMYEAKGRHTSSKSGVGEKVFEFLLIPRQAGEVHLPAIEVAFFDPAKKEYVVRKTEPITISVKPPAPGSAAFVPRAQTSASKTTGAQAPAAAPEIAGWMTASGDSGDGFVERATRWLPIVAWAIFGLACIVAFGRALGRQGMLFARSRRVKKVTASKGWQQLRARARKLESEGGWPELVAAYEALSVAIWDDLDERYDVGARSLPRAELGRILVGEKGMAEAQWKRIAEVLEYAEMVRFAASSGVVTLEDARKRLGAWIDQASGTT